MPFGFSSCRIQELKWTSLLNLPSGSCFAIATQNGPTSHSLQQPHDRLPVNPTHSSLCLCPSSPCSYPLAAPSLWTASVPSLLPVQAASQQPGSERSIGPKKDERLLLPNPSCPSLPSMPALTSWEQDRRVHMIWRTVLMDQGWVSAAVFLHPALPGWPTPVLWGRLSKVDPSPFGQTRFLHYLEKVLTRRWTWFFCLLTVICYTPSDFLVPRTLR